MCPTNVNTIFPFQIDALIEILCPKKYFKIYILNNSLLFSTPLTYFVFNKISMWTPSCIWGMCALLWHIHCAGGLIWKHKACWALKFNWHSERMCFFLSSWEMYQVSFWWLIQVDYSKILIIYIFLKTHIWSFIKVIELIVRKLLAKILSALWCIYLCISKLDQLWGPGLICKIHISQQGFSDMFFDWLAAVPPANEKTGLKIHINMDFNMEIS